VWFAHPGQIADNSICRPSARFFTRFTKLTDVIAARPERINRTQLVANYKEAAINNPAKVQQIVEVALDRYVSAFIDPHRKLVDRWTNPTLGKTKSFLRRTQSSGGEYIRLARFLGCPEGEQYPLGEWREMEKAGYKCLADVL
jgi:hypothetical protein